MIDSPPATSVRGGERVDHTIGPPIWCIAVACVSIAVAAFGCSASKSSESPPAAEPEPGGDVRLQTTAHPPSFRPEQIRVAPGQEVTVELTTTDRAEPPGHSFVQLDGNDRTEATAVARAGWDAPDSGYIPDDDGIIGSIRAVPPGASDSVTLDAPEQPGEYLYLCTVPGHFPPMAGRLIVEPRD